MKHFVIILLFSQTAPLNEVSLEGDITVPGAPDEDTDEELNTLDEPVKDTVVCTKHWFSTLLFSFQ